MNKHQRVTERRILNYARGQGYGVPAQLWSDFGVTINFEGRDSVHISTAFMTEKAGAGSKPFNTMIEKTVDRAAGSKNERTGTD